MSTDRELLELAAKAAGYTTNHPWNAERLTFNPPVDALFVHDKNGRVHTAWNPLYDSGAALNLACRLYMTVKIDDGMFTLVDAENWQRGIFVDAVVELHKDSTPLQATCRAIVRAAAEIGRAMT